MGGNSEFEQLRQDSGSVFTTLSEAFADLTALTYGKRESTPVERNPFKEKYRGAFEGLEQAFNKENREEELELLEKTKDDVDERNYRAIVDNIEKLEDYVPDIDFGRGRKIRKNYNVFLLGTEGFFMTSKDSTAVNEDQVDYLAKYSTSESPVLHPESISQVTHGAHNDRGILNKSKEVLGVQSMEDVTREEVKDASDRVISELILGRLNPTIRQVKKQIDIVESEDVGEYALERMDYDGYGSSDDRTDEDVDLPHEVGGVLAESLYENDIEPVDVAKNPTKYAEIAKEAAIETIDYGVGTAAGETSQDWGNAVTGEYRNRLDALL